MAHSGRDWKAVEDIVDTHLCAYRALLWERRGTGLVLGRDSKWQAGYVVIPDESPVVASP